MESLQIWHGYTSDIHLRTEEIILFTRVVNEISERKHGKCEKLTIFMQEGRMNVPYLSFIWCYIQKSNQGIKHNFSRVYGHIRYIHVNFDSLALTAKKQGWYRTFWPTLVFSFRRAHDRPIFIDDNCTFKTSSDE